MLLTKQILKNYRASSECIVWYTSNDEPDSVEETIEKLLSSDEHKKFGWSNWLLSRVLPLDDKIRYTIFAAELVIDIFEKEFPEDKRPRNVIETVREYLLNKDDAMAREVARAANEATSVADHAVTTVTDAAYAAAYAVDYVVYVAREADAAREAGAAYAAARAADYMARATADADVTYTKIINYGLSLLKSK
ncbi:MAG: hypothetical protein WC260_01390 [Candidatus Pacearchaeota archaeon]